MGKRDRRIDAYIAKSADFAKPILTYLREIVHAGCPEVEETLKWSNPSFMYEGSVLCGMAAFKALCMFHFWNSGRVVGDKPELEQALGRITSMEDLPPKKELLRLVKKGANLIDEG